MHNDIISVKYSNSTVQLVSLVKYNIVYIQYMEYSKVYYSSHCI